MILRGLMDTSLGGFLCMRGYAAMGDLSRVSYADMAYQRDLMKDHSETVVRFLRNKKDLFFPEVVLSCVLKYDYSKRRANSTVNPIVDVLGGRGFKSNVDGITVGVRALSYKARGDVRSSTGTRIATLTVPDGLVVPGPGPLFRIDGNHRLSAADKATEFKDILAPFCVILFGAGAEDKRSSKTIFHNINSKSIPLTPEEIYRIVLDDDVLFPDETLRTSPSFGLPLLLARKAQSSVEPAAVPSLEAVLKNPRTALVGLFKLLFEKKAIQKSLATLPDVQACFKRVEAIYAADADLAAKRCVGLFHAFVYFCITDPTRKLLKPFTHWVAGNRLAALEETDAHALIEIFESIHTAKARTVFVSMQFGNDTDDTYDTIKRAVAAVNADARPKIKIEQLRIDKLNKGYSYTITDAILATIEESGLLIADLTHANPNVYHEVGYMMGLNRGRGLKQENFILIAKEEPAGGLDQKVGFNLRGVSQIRFKRFADLEAKLAEHIRKYYGLSDEGA